MRLIDSRRFEPTTHPYDVLLDDFEPGTRTAEIQAMFDRLGPARCPELSVKADEPAIRVRRLIAQMIQRERAASDAA